MAFLRKEVVNFLGNGITLPLNLKDGAAVLESGEHLIKASIRMILAWNFGTRFFLCEFGSRVEELLEEPNDDVLLHTARILIVEALEIWERRIEIIDVELERSEHHKLDLTIVYRIISSNKTDTFTFPFYKEIKT